MLALTIPHGTVLAGLVRECRQCERYQFCCKGGGAVGLRALAVRRRAACRKRWEDGLRVPENFNSSGCGLGVLCVSARVGRGPGCGSLGGGDPAPCDGAMGRLWCVELIGELDQHSAYLAGHSTIRPTRPVGDEFISGTGRSGPELAAAKPPRTSAQVSGLAWIAAMARLPLNSKVSFIRSEAGWRATADNQTETQDLAPESC
jgi:hypothetical protein